MLAENQLNIFAKNQSGYEIPSAGLIIPMLFKWQGNKFIDSNVIVTNANFGADAVQLKTLLNDYHRLPLNKRFLLKRIQGLTAIAAFLKKLEKSTKIKKIVLDEFVGHLNWRLEFLNYLYSFTNQRKTYINKLLDIFIKGGNYEYQQGSGMYMSLHSTRVVERLDPLHRRDISRSFYLDWLMKQATMELDPVDNLINFFLDLDIAKATKKMSACIFFSKNQIKFCKLILDPMESIYTTYYYYETDAWNKYLPDSLTQEYVPFLKPFHSVLQPASVKEGKTYKEVKYNNEASRIEKGIVDFWGAYIYLMSENQLFAYPSNNNFHSKGLQGECLQAAGMIVGIDGKIVAIDNASGHYQPSWKYLQQAVKLILADNAFADEAWVGVCFMDGNVFTKMLFTVDAFLKLAAISFPLKDTIIEVKKLKLKYPNFVADFKYQKKYNVFLRLMRGNDLFDQTENTWENQLNKFLSSLYPKFENTLELFEDIFFKRISWKFSEFKSESYLIIGGRGGKIGKVDNALIAYDMAYNDLKLSLQQSDTVFGSLFNNGEKIYLNLIAFIEKLVDLLQSCNEWLLAKETKSGTQKRFNAVTTLKGQLEKEWKRLIEVKTNYIWRL